MCLCVCDNSIKTIFQKGNNGLKLFIPFSSQLQVSNQISKDLTSKVVLICVEELQDFVDIYRSKKSFLNFWKNLGLY